MIVANPNILRIEGIIPSIKYYPLREIGGYIHIRENHKLPNIYLCGMKMGYTKIELSDSIITCPECKQLYRLAKQKP